MKIFIGLAEYCTFQDNSENCIDQLERDNILSSDAGIVDEFYIFVECVVEDSTFILR